MIDNSPAHRRRDADALRKDRRNDTLARRAGGRTPEAGDALPRAPPRRDAPENRRSLLLPRRLPPRGPEPTFWPQAARFVLIDCYIIIRINREDKVASR